MKKIIVFLLSVVIAAVPPAAYAKSGDVIGAVYATDIKTYINGTEVPSYNIGGKTAVIIEDIFESYCYYYSDAHRMLAVSRIPSGFPEPGGFSNHGGTPGTPVGKIYESDIKTCIYDKQVSAFSLNGKTAVAVEDIAGDKEWSDIGARYFWNDSERTLSVEFMYDNSARLSVLMGEKHLNADVTEGVMTVQPDPLNYGGCMWDNGEGSVKYDGNVVGEYFSKPYYWFDEDTGEFVLENEPNRFIYWDTEMLENIFSSAETVYAARQQIIDFYLKDMSPFYKVKARLDTDDYTFMYLELVGAPHGGTELLLRISEDGSTVNYADDFESVSAYGRKYFEGAVLDETARTFAFRYGENYIIDLDSGELKNN